jgi:hypothetical protein
MTDDVLDEVRRAREAYGERFGFDLEAIGRDLREQERRSGRRIVNYLTDRAEHSQATSSGDESTISAEVAIVRSS